jgi:uncharacterized protein
MANSCFDPSANDEEADTVFAMLADPFRRRLLSAAILTMSSGALAAAGVPLPSLAASAGRATGAIDGFASIPPSTADAVILPDGYTASLLYAWGDPISDGPRAHADAGDDAAAQRQQAGMHHDGMHFFPFVENGKQSSTHGLLYINHEYTDDGLLHAGGMHDWSAAKVAKSKAAHGVSVIEIRHGKDGWQVVRPPWRAASPPTRRAASPARPAPIRR